MTYKQVYDDEWVRPRRRGYRMACCDCGLVHVLDFHIETYGGNQFIWFKAKRDKRATAQRRRKVTSPPA